MGMIRLRETKRDRREDRGVSEVLSFILMFGIILGSVALLSTTGFPAMSNYQETEQLRNAERGMEALATNFNDVLRYDGIEKRYGELSLRQGTVSTGSGGTELEILLDGSTQSVNGSDSVELGTFTYEAHSHTIAYEGGGVVRAGRTGSTVVKRPRVTCLPESETVVVELAIIDASESSIQSGGGTGFTMTELRRDTIIKEGVNNVSIEVTTSYERAWNASFERSGWETTGSASADFRATCADSADNPVNRVVITVVTTDVEY